MGVYVGGILQGGATSTFPTGITTTKITGITGGDTLNIVGNLQMITSDPLGEIVAQELFVFNGSALDDGQISTDGSGNLTANTLNANNGFSGNLTTITGVATFVNGICTGYTGS
jgi:hypothetical protein